jgi:hypothetical protein
MQHQLPKQARKFHDAWIRQEPPEVATYGTRCRFIGGAEVNEKDAEGLGESVLVLRR